MIWSGGDPTPDLCGHRRDFSGAVPGRYRDIKQRNERERHPQPLFTAEFIAADCTRVSADHTKVQPAPAGQYLQSASTPRFNLHHDRYGLGQGQDKLQCPKKSVSTRCAVTVLPSTYCLVVIMTVLCFLCILSRNCLLYSTSDWIRSFTGSAVAAAPIYIRTYPPIFIRQLYHDFVKFK